MQDRPTQSELLAAVQTFIENDVLPGLDGPKKFHARVAANVLAIVQRELDLEERHLHDEWQRLERLLGPATLPEGRNHQRQAVHQRTVELALRIRRGDADSEPWRREVLRHVRHTVAEKLAVTNPKMLERNGRDGKNGSERP